MQQRACLVAATAFAVFLMAPASQASTIYALDITSTCCGPGPYGSVTLTQNGANEVDVFVSLVNPFLFVDGGQAGAFAFDLDIANANLSITVSPASLTAGFSSTVLDHGAHGEHMSAFGFFDYAIAGDASHTHGGSTPIGQALTLMVVNTAGAISANDFEEDSTGGIDSYFAADIMNTASAGLGAGTTGIVATFGGTTTSATPEPTTFMLLGAGLVAVAFLRRKRVSKT